MKYPLLRCTAFLAVIGLQSCGGGSSTTTFAGTEQPSAGPAAPDLPPPPTTPPVTPPTSTDMTFTVMLTPMQEIAEPASLASGTGTLTLNPATNAISGSITVSNMNATDAHIHLAAAGVNGAIIIPLARDASDTNRWNIPANTVLTAEQRAALDAGNLYFNAHSPAYPNGEIRGQIGREVMLARLSGMQKNPPTASAGTGLGVIALDPATKTADLTLTYANITPTMAHVHTEGVGVNGPITFDLGTPSGNRYARTGVTFTDAQIADFRGKRMYFNIHTAANPNGEIRGQIGYMERVSTMTGAQEVPPNPSAATGLGYALYDPDNKTVYSQFTVTGLSPTDGHIHRGAPGVAGPIAVPFRYTTNLQLWHSDGFVPLSDADALLLLNGGMYHNSHSALYPAGEIRGQLLPR